MSKIDPVRERQRLSKLYSEMSDEELEKVGNNPRSLTEWARDTLRQEMTKRGLEWNEPADIEEESSEVPKVELPDELSFLVPLRSYQDVTKASADHRALTAGGLDVYYFTDKVGPEGFFAWRPSDSVDLLVRAGDLAVSLELLAKKREPAADEPASGDTAEAEAFSGKPIVLRTYRDITEALVDRTTLESTGIKCVLYDDNLVRLDWFISNAIGGVKLVVSENDAREASEILAQARPAEQQ